MRACPLSPGHPPSPLNPFSSVCVSRASLRAAGSCIRLPFASLEALAVHDGGAGLVELSRGERRCQFISVQLSRRHTQAPSLSLSLTSSLLIHMDWKVERDARMDPPIHTEYLRSGGATIFTFMDDGASATSCGERVKRRNVRSEGGEVFPSLCAACSSPPWSSSRRCPGTWWCRRIGRCWRTGPCGCPRRTS